MLSNSEIVTLTKLHFNCASLLRDHFKRVPVYDCIYLQGKQVPITKELVSELYADLCEELLENGITWEVQEN